MRCNDQEVIAYLLRTRSKAAVVHVLSNLCDQGVYTFIPEAQAQLYKFRPVAMHEGISIVKVRSVCRSSADNTLVVAQGDMKPTIPLPAFTAGQGHEMHLSQCFGTPQAALKALEKRPESRNVRRKA